MDEKQQMTKSWAACYSRFRSVGEWVSESDHEVAKLHLPILRNVATGIGLLRERRFYYRISTAGKRVLVFPADVVRFAWRALRGSNREVDGFAACCERLAAYFQLAKHADYESVEEYCRREGMLLVEGDLEMGGVLMDDMTEGSPRELGTPRGILSAMACDDEMRSLSVRVVGDGEWYKALSRSDVQAISAKPVMRWQDAHSCFAISVDEATHSHISRCRLQTLIR